LDLAEEQIGQIDAIYAKTLEANEVSGRLQALVKNVLDNQRSALEFVAYAVVETYGDTSKLGKVHWPNTTDPTKFQGLFDFRVPGVRANRSDIADAFERHQEFQPDHEWATRLFPLSVENKHHMLSPQTNESLVPRPIMSPSYPGRPIHITPTVVFIDWTFADHGVPVLNTLKAIQHGVSVAVQDVSAVAGL